MSGRRQRTTMEGPTTGVAFALDRALGALGPDRSLTERVAMFAAAASVGPSFEPGLQPRRTIDQAIATGVIAATTLSAVTVAESAIESVARLITRGRTDTSSASARLTFTVGSNALIRGGRRGPLPRPSPARGRAFPSRCPTGGRQSHRPGGGNGHSVVGRHGCERSGQREDCIATVADAHSGRLASRSRALRVAHSSDSSIGSGHG